EAEAATARAEAAEKLGVEEREAVAQAEDAARKATKALKAEAAKAAKAAAAAKAATQAAATARANAAAANQAAATARASAAADVAAASAAAAAAAQQAESENSLRRRTDVLSLAASLEALAAGNSAARTADTSSQPNAGKKRGRGSATPGTGPQTTAVEPTDEATAPAGAQSRRGGGTASGGGGCVELPALTKAFCGFLAAYTAQGLPLDALVGLIQAAPSTGGRGGGDNNDGVERGDVPPPPPVQATEMAKKKSREAAAVKQEKTAASVLPPPAAATATPAPAPDGDSLSAAPADAAAATTTPPESVVATARPTTTRREMLNARRAEKEREAREKERIQEEKERERAERQREARKKRKQEAALQKAAEAAARQQADEARKKAAETEAATAAVAAPAAAAATAPAAVLSSPAVPSLSQEQEQEQEQEQRGETKLLRAHNTKSKRVKPVKQALLPQQQPRQPHGQKRPVGGTEARNRKHSVNVSSSSSDVALADEPGLPKAASVHAVAAAAAVTDHDEVGEAVVEEVPMPTGDIDDGFFCADVGGVGGSNSVGLIMGGGGGGGGDGDGYGMVGAWSHQGGGAIAAVGSGSGAALDSGPGEKKKRCKGRSRKPEAVVEPLNTGARSVEGGESGDEGSGMESKKKKRRRSMRLVKAPVKFGDEEPGAGGPRSPEPKLDQRKGLAPKLEPTLAIGQGSESSGREASSVDNASVSHAPFSEGGTAADATAATSAAIIPAAASQVAASASAETVKPTAEAAGGAIGGGAAAAQNPSGRTTDDATVSQQRAPPFAKRKLAALANSTKWIRANRFRGGATAATCATAGAAAAPPLSRESHPKVTSDLLAAAAAVGAATTSPTDSISATATAAKMAVDDLFDTAALQLSAATPPSQQAVATKTAVGGGGGREKARGGCAGAGVPAGGGRVSKPKPRGGCAGEGVPTGGERASKAKPNAREVKVAVTEAVMAERLLPYGAEITDGVTARDIFEAASSRSWVGDGSGAEGGPRGALTGVLATARVLMQKASGPGGASSLQSSAPPDAMLQFESFLTTIVATEACAMKHELRAGTEAGETVPPSAGAGAGAAAKAAGGKKKKGVRFCAFDLSTVDMPTDAIEDSDAAAKEVAQCLARVVASSKLLQEGMPKRASGAGGAGKAAAVADGGIGGGLASAVKAFMRGLKTIAGVAEPDSCLLVSSARGACRELGTEISTEVVKRAAALLLESFEALKGGAEVAATRCPLRQRLAIMLSALIRFNLRTLLNPPPLKPLSSLHIADSTDKPRKVHEVIQLVSEESKPPSKKDAFDPTRDGAASAVLSRALRRV
ncbi:unnamed protein product, partial [Ectocarpus sp. 12 AP-2014]